MPRPDPPTRPQPTTLYRPTTRYPSTRRRPLTTKRPSTSLRRPTTLYPSTRRRAATIVGLVLVIVGSTACGADAEPPSPESTVVENNVDGRRELTGAVVDGADRPDLDGVVFDFDGRFGALAVETPCGTMLGSYSLFDDGRAGVTITGGTSRDCGQAETESDDALRSALGRIAAWVEVGGDVELRSAGERDRLPLAS